jgi:hypothetical protein
MVFISLPWQKIDCLVAASSAAACAARVAGAVYQVDCGFDQYYVPLPRR